MNNKTSYRELCRNEATIPLFSQDWWLDAAVGAEGWDVALAAKADAVIGAMPYVQQRRFGLNVVTQPPLTRQLGPWLREMPGKTSTRLAQDKEIMFALIAQLPDFDHFSQNWHYTYGNWLPFSWQGFSQTTRYTYLLDDVTDTGRIWDGLHDEIRAQCDQAVTRELLEVRDDLPLSEFLGLDRKMPGRRHVQGYRRQALLARLEQACTERGCRACLIAVDREGRKHAGIYIAWDKGSTYVLAAAVDPALADSGALSLCYWKAIVRAAAVARRFDFSGSMEEAVEHYFRRFGARQVPYSNVTKTPSRLLRLRQGLLQMMRPRSAERRAQA